MSKGGIYLAVLLGLLVWSSSSLGEGVDSVQDQEVEGIVDVYVVPITEGITKPNRFVLRRALKEAIENEIDMVILDMDTPGGGVGYTLEMMEMLNRFDGITATYVNDDAISAGSFIAASTQEIYFAPTGKIGASAVIMGTGEDIPEVARQKIESYLLANIRVMTEDYPYRAEVIRAMLDAEFELKIGDDIIKPEGGLLTLTAKEAMQEYGDPSRPLLGNGIYENIEALLDDRFGEGNYQIKAFDLTYSEVIAKWMSTFAPALMGIGLLLLFLEFKTPGFGLFGIGGIALIAIFFISQYIAGLAGNELIVFFVLGVVLVLLEVLFFPGVFIFGISGIVLMLGSLLFAMVDVWPKGSGVSLNLEMFMEPLFNLILGLSITFVGAFLASRLLKGSWMERRLVLGSAVGGGSLDAEQRLDDPAPVEGTIGRVISALHPVGRIEIDGKRYDARSLVGGIDQGAAVRVVRSADFVLVVEGVEK